MWRAPSARAIARARPISSWRWTSAAICFRPGQRIVDLGAAPGGWSQVAADRVKAAEGKGQVVAVDLLEMVAVPGVDFAVKDFNDPDAPDFIKAKLSGLADGVISDMAANTTGHKATDHLRIVALAELAADFAAEILKPGGFFVAKVLQGGTEGELLARLKRDFATVRHQKPAASRPIPQSSMCWRQAFARSGTEAAALSSRL